MSTRREALDISDSGPQSRACEQTDARDLSQLPHALSRACKYDKLTLGAIDPLLSQFKHSAASLIKSNFWRQIISFLQNFRS